MQEDQVFGLHAVLAALQQTPERVDVVWVEENRRDRRVSQLFDAAAAAHVKVRKVPRAKLDQMAEGERHQGAIARLLPARRRSEDELPELLASIPGPPFLLVLDGVQDPHNLGACLRSADAAGAHAVLIPRDQSVSVTATVRKVASGAAESLPVFQVTNLARTLAELKREGIWLVGAAGDAPQRLYDVDLRGPLALVLGGEGKGLRRLTREACDFLVQIPMLGHVHSLNVSVAAGVCLFEAVRQRHSVPPA